MSLKPSNLRSFRTLQAWSDSARNTLARPVFASGLAVFGISVQAAAQETAAQPPGGGMGSTLMFMAVLIGVMWLFLFRPNQIREKERKAMLASIGKGDEVVTTGGMLGTVVGVKDKTVVLKVSDDPATKVEFLRAAISQVSSKHGEKEKDTKEDN